MNIKNIWDNYTDKFGRTIFHPQYIKKNIEYRAIEEIKKNARGKVVDIGCGRMSYKKEFNPKLITYIGVDHPKISQLYHPLEKPDYFADASRLPFKNATIDAILLLQVLEYLQNPAEAFKEFYRVLKPNGKIFITSPFLYPIHDFPFDLMRHTPSSIKNLLQYSGFEKEKVIASGSFIEFYLQSLLIFIFKRIFQIMKKRMNFISVLSLVFLILAGPFLVLLSNVFVVIIKPIQKYLGCYENDFPLDIYATAKKKNKNSRPHNLSSTK